MVYCIYIILVVSFVMKELKGQREQTIKCRDGIEEICEWNGLTVVPKEVPVTVNRANASMMVFSMMEIAKAKGLDPQKYLQY